MNKRSGILVIISVIALAMTFIAPVSPAGALSEPMPANDPAAGLIYDGLTRDATLCPKGFRLIGTNMCTHGPDRAPASIDVRTHFTPPIALTDAEPKTSPTHCVTNGSNGKRTQVVYFRAPNRTDRYNTYLSSIRSYAAEADQIFWDSAAEVGEGRRLRFVHDSSCNISVLNIVGDQNSDDDNLTNTINEFVRQGLNSTSRKYMIFADAAVYCGIARIKNDSDASPSANNSNNGPGYARTDFSCWSPGTVPAHETMHVMGGVQLNAPHATGWDGNNGYHCYDEWDRMCYNDASTYFDNGGSLTYPCGGSGNSARDRLFDCNHDDYYTTAPGNTYLTNFWNTANNNFLRNDTWLSRAGDFNGDGKDDIIYFTRGGTGDVYVALSEATGSVRRFQTTPTRWHSSFCYGEELPLVGDFNNDGRDDIATFTRGTGGNVYVALSNGSSFVGSGVLWHGSFAYKDEIPAVGDFNGDGRDDIATFTRNDTGNVYVALSNGSSFVGSGVLWNGNNAYYDDIPAVGDFNGDGRDDIVKFTRGTTADAYVYLSTGSSFGSGAKWHDSFGYRFEQVEVGDVDGNGRDDIITFKRGGYGDVYVAKSTGSSFSGSGVLWHGTFCYRTEVCGVGNFNGGAGWADIITFTRGSLADVYVALSNGSSGFVGSGVKWHDNFAPGTTIPAAGRIS